MESTEALNAQALKALIKESLREVLREERLNLCKLLMPLVSDRIMAINQGQVEEISTTDIVYRQIQITHI